MEFVRRPGDSFRFFKCFLPQHEEFGESEVKIDFAVPVRAFPSVLNRLCRDWATSGPSVDFNMMSFSPVSAFSREILIWLSGNSPLPFAWCMDVARFAGFHYNPNPIFIGSESPISWQVTLSISTSSSRSKMMLHYTSRETGVLWDLGLVVPLVHFTVLLWLLPVTCE